jgi:hypothetical protein
VAQRHSSSGDFGAGTWIKDGIIWLTVNFEQTTPDWADTGYPLTARR